MLTYDILSQQNISMFRRVCVCSLNFVFATKDICQQCTIAHILAHTHTQTHTHRHTYIHIQTCRNNQTPIFTQNIFYLQMFGFCNKKKTRF